MAGRLDGWRRQWNLDVGTMVVSNRANDPSDGKASYWLTRAASMLDCAVQCCGGEEAQEVIDMETRCDELAKQLRERGR